MGLPREGSCAYGKNCTRERGPIKQDENRFRSLNVRAPNLRRLEKGDKVIFYIAEAKRKGFMVREY